MAPSVCITSSMRERADGEAVLARDLDGVGQVELALGVVVGQPRQRADQELRVEGQDPRADLGMSRWSRRGVLLLDDRLDVALVVAQDPAVAERVGHDSRSGCSPPARPPGGRPRTAQALALAAAGCRPSPPATVPRVVPLALAAPLDGAARCPSSTSCTASTASGTSSWTCAPTCSRWWPTTATTRCGSTDRTAVSTWPIMLRPADVVEHLHRLALHAGAATGRQDDDGQLVSFAHAPRVGVEPTSLVLIQSQAGPTGRPTGDCFPLRARLAGQHPGPADQPGIVCPAAGPPSGAARLGPADQPGIDSAKDRPCRRSRFDHEGSVRTKPPSSASGRPLAGARGARPAKVAPCASSSPPRTTTASAAPRPTSTPSPSSCSGSATRSASTPPTSATWRS